jgi:integrase
MRLADSIKIGLCQAHTYQWRQAGKPVLSGWVASAPALYPDVDEVSLAGIDDRLHRQILVAVVAYLRDGRRLQPSKLRTTLTWLEHSRVDNLRTAVFPLRSAYNQHRMYLWSWQDLLTRRPMSPAEALGSSAIPLKVLNPKYEGTVHLDDVSQPWLLHVAQEEVKRRVAKGESDSVLFRVAHAVRFFSKFLQDECIEDGLRPATINRDTIVAYLLWLKERARDSLLLTDLPIGDPRRRRYEGRLVTSKRYGGQPLLVTPHLHSHAVQYLKVILENHHEILTAQGAGQLFISVDELVPHPRADRSKSEEEGRSEDAIPEAVFFQLLDPKSLALIPEGTRRNFIELSMRLGRRPWEMRNLRYNCVSWDEVRTGSDTRKYAYVRYWMRKTQKWHAIPVLDLDLAVIERQQRTIAAWKPEWFSEEGQPIDPELLLFPSNSTWRQADGRVGFMKSAAMNWIQAFRDALPDIADDDGRMFDKHRIFMYAFRHTFAQIRADKGMPLDVLQALMGHSEPASTQCYFEVSRPRTIDAVVAIADEYQFDNDQNRLLFQRQEDGDAARLRVGIGSVPVPAGKCHELNNVRADGHGCPINFRCFACRFYSTDFTHLAELRRLREDKADHLVALQAALGTVLRKGGLSDANILLIQEELAQVDELIGKCEADLAGLPPDRRSVMEAWMRSSDRFGTQIPLDALQAAQMRLQEPTVDPGVLVEMGMTRRHAGKTG